MTVLLALAPLLLTPLIAWLLIEYGPERSVVFAAYWIVMSIAFAIAMPLFRRRRSLAMATTLGAIVAIISTMAVFAALLFGVTVRARAATPPGHGERRAGWVQSEDTTVRTPAAGSAMRSAILDAVRARVGVRSRFKVSHVRTTDRWAFIRCVEVVNDGEQLQETDLDVAALLERQAGAKGAGWKVAELWALSDDQERPYARFARRVRDRARTARIPGALFPAGFLSSDVPTD